jgi:hypothetical protein
MLKSENQFYKRIKRIKRIRNKFDTKIKKNNVKSTSQSKLAWKMYDPDREIGLSS